MKIAHLLVFAVLSAVLIAGCTGQSKPQNYEVDLTSLTEQQFTLAEGNSIKFNVDGVPYALIAITNPNEFQLSSSSGTETISVSGETNIDLDKDGTVDITINSQTSGKNVVLNVRSKTSSRQETTTTTTLPATTTTKISARGQDTSEDVIGDVKYLLLREEVLFDLLRMELRNDATVAFSDDSPIVQEIGFYYPTYYSENKQSEIFTIAVEGWKTESAAENAYAKCNEESDYLDIESVLGTEELSIGEKALVTTRRRSWKWDGQDVDVHRICIKNKVFVISVGIAFGAKPEDGNALAIEQNRKINEFITNEGLPSIPTTTQTTTTQPTISWENWIRNATLGATFLSDIHFVNTNIGWVVGDGGKIFKTTDGGNNWSIQTSGTRGPLYAIHFVNENIGWVVGNAGIILNTIDGGNTWSTQKSRVIETLTSIYFVDANVGWAVGVGGTLIETKNGGGDWMQTSISFNSRDVYLSDSSSGVIVGDFGNVLKLVDGKWIKQESGTKNHLNGVYFIDSNTGWVVGGGGTILKTTDGGSTWIIQTSKTTNSLNDVFFTDSNNGWAVGSWGTIAKTRDGGSSWVVDRGGLEALVNIYIDTWGFSGVYFVDTNTGWMVDNVGYVWKYTG